MPSTAAPRTHGELTPDQRARAVDFATTMAEAASTRLAAALKNRQRGAAIRAAGDALGHLIEAQQLEQ